MCSKYGKSPFKILCLQLVFIVNLSACLFAQPRLRFERISLEQGLSQSIVRTIYQDSKGFLWFGTQDGLNKSDGLNFTVYKHDPFDSTSLSHTDIVCIYEAPSEPTALWIGTNGGGLNRLDRETETFTRFRNIPKDTNSLSHDYVAYIYEDSAENLWVITADAGGGLDRLDRETATFTHFRHDPNDLTSISHSTVTSIFEDQSGTLWIGTPKGLNQFDRHMESFVRYQYDPGNRNSLSHDFVLSIFEAKHEPGILWIGTGNPKTLEGGGLNRFDTRNGTFTHYRHDPDDPNSLSIDIVGPIHEDHHGRLWLGTLGLVRFERDTGIFTQFLPDPANPVSLSNGVRFILEDKRGHLWLDTVPVDEGVYEFDPDTETFTHHLHDPNDPNSLSTNNVLSFYEDRSAVLWFGTEVGGLNKVDQFGQKFISYSPDPDNPNSLSNKIVRAIYEDGEGLLWLGVADGGLNKLNRKTDHFTHYRHNSSDPRSLSDDNVWCIFEDHAGVFWIGTFGGGLNRFNRTTETFKHYRHEHKNPNSLSNDLVRVIYESPAEPGVLWIGTEGGGLNRFDVKGEKFTHFRNKADDPKSLSNEVVRAIAEDSAGNLWIGTVGGGLNLFDRKTETFRSYEHDPTNPNSIGIDYVQSIYADSSGILWLGTFGGGLNRFNPGTEMFTVYSEQNSGLCNNVVYGILEDDHGNLWLSTNGGICKFNPQSNTFKTYDVDDGLQSREFNGQSYFKNQAGEMFFGGINGFNVFHPDSVNDNPFVPQIALTDFRIFSESVAIGGGSPLKKHISETEEITLAHWQNDISFEFVALHFSHPEENKYAFRLENYDDEWREVGTQRTATYTNLSPAEYVFSVKGSNSDGVWNEEETSIRIIITPPFWETWGFRALVILLVIGLAFSLYKRRIKNVRMKTELRAAHDAQMAIMPQTDPQIKGFEISGVCIPANEVGGDFFDYVWLNDKRTKLAIAIGDVSGKAMSSAMTAVMSDGMICAKADERMSIKDMMARLNRAMYLKTEKKMFTALCLAALDIETNELIFTNAGLIEPLLKSGNSLAFIKGTGSTHPLGGKRENIYRETKLHLQSGDVLIFVTDGVPEAQNHSREQYGEQRLKHLIRKLDTCSLSAKEIKEQIVNDVTRFASRVQHDDMSVVVLKMTGDEKPDLASDVFHLLKRDSADAGHDYSKKRNRGQEIEQM